MRQCSGGWSCISSLWSVMKCPLMSYEMSMVLGPHWSHSNRTVSLHSVPAGWHLPFRTGSTVCPPVNIPPLRLHRTSSLCLSIKPSQSPMLFIHSLADDKGLGHTIGTTLIKITFVLSPATCKKLRLTRVLNSRSYSKHSIS